MAPVIPSMALIVALIVVSRSIDPRRGVIKQASLCIVTIRSMIDGILVGQTCAIASEEV